MIGEIDASGAAVVWVGTGQPKQEKWMLHMRPRLSAPLLVGVGAAFDFHAGLVSQAPRLDAALGPGVDATASRASRGACGDGTPTKTLASSRGLHVSTCATAETIEADLLDDFRACVRVGPAPAPLTSSLA